eukprot:3869750-Pleurochrysis_carterae.AAC.1
MSTPAAPAVPLGAAEGPYGTATDTPIAPALIPDDVRADGDAGADADAHADADADADPDAAAAAAADADAPATPAPPPAA